MRSEYVVLIDGAPLIGGEVAEAVDVWESEARTVVLSPASQSGADFSLDRLLEDLYETFPACVLERTR